MGIVALFLLPPILALAPHLSALLIPIAALAQPVVVGAGIGLLIASRIITPLAVLPLRRSQRHAALAQTGLFAWSRNPTLLGLFAFYLGNALLFPCAVLLLGFPLCVLHMHRRVGLEEIDLRARFGAEYAAYEARVPRYLGLRALPATYRRAPRPPPLRTDGSWRDRGAGSPHG